VVNNCGNSLKYFRDKGTSCLQPNSERVYIFRGKWNRRGTDRKREGDRERKRERRKENHFSFPFQGIICNLKLTWGVQNNGAARKNGPLRGRPGARMPNEGDVELFRSLSSHNIYLMQFNSSGLLAALRILLSSSQSPAILLQLLRARGFQLRLG
jgi:hypothetical protein